MRPPEAQPGVWEMQQAPDQKQKAGKCLVSRQGLEQSLSEVTVDRVLNLKDFESVDLGWVMRAFTSNKVPGNAGAAGAFEPRRA